MTTGGAVHCGHCGAEVAPGARGCASCGASYSRHRRPWLSLAEWLMLSSGSLFMLTGSLCTVAGAQADDRWSAPILAFALPTLLLGLAVLRAAWLSYRERRDGGFVGRFPRPRG